MGWRLLGDAPQEGLPGDGLGWQLRESTVGAVLEARHTGMDVHTNAGTRALDQQPPVSFRVEADVS